MIPVGSSPVWNASDLARHRRAIISSAQKGLAVVRASDGTLLAVTTAQRLQALEFTPRVARLLASAMALLDIEPSIGELGELAFAAHWPLARRTDLARDVRQVALHALESRNVAELDAFIEASRPRIAAGPVDAGRLATLLSD